ncbi:SGNH/GDSL hydrolase family protein [Rhodococcus sp. NPDC054953]
MSPVAAVAAALVLTAPAPLGASTAAQAESPPPVGYVALGDSFSSGAGIAPNGSLGDCLRSEVNYPHLVAAAVRATTFRDVTCSGATTANLSDRQLPQTAPQFDALSPDTTLVTVGIGANDIGLVSLTTECLNVAPPPLGRSCAATTDTAAYAERIDGLAPTYVGIVEEIRRRAPDARIVLVGYPDAIRPGGCPGVQPIWPVDADHVQGLITRLNTVTATAASTAGATFVDLEPSTRGHDACAAPADRWIVGAVPTSLTAPIPLHPNAAGHANAATQVIAAVTR